MRKIIFADWRTTTRPYISDKGASRKGPMAYASKKIDMMRYVSNPDVIENSSASVGSAGASIVEETGEMKVKQDTRMVEVHFLPRLQL